MENEEINLCFLALSKDFKQLKVHQIIDIWSELIDSLSSENKDLSSFRCNFHYLNEYSV